MTIIQCDRCHREIRKCDKANSGEKIGKYVVIRTYQDDADVRSIGHYGHEPLDLCSDCARKLADFIDGHVNAVSD